jgi:FlaA1/EpsC-like NDP-sugar epimerase
VLAFSSAPQILHVRNRWLFASDATALVISGLFAFLLRFESTQWLAANPALIFGYLAATVPLRLAVFYFAGLYRRLWRHASIGDLKRILVVSGASAVLAAAIGLFVLPALGVVPHRVPLSVLFMDALLVSGAVALPRLMLRTMAGAQPRRRRTHVPGRPALLVGAGGTAKLVVKELLSNPALNLEPVGFVDDDATKHNHTMCDLPVLGPLSAIPEIVQRFGVAEIIITMPSAPGPMVRKVVRAALDCGVAARTVPSLPEILSANMSRTALREVEIQDLLRREPVQIDLAAIAALATNETVLVTGAGGSIGAELCRQLARLAPARLIAVGHAENEIFEVVEELRSMFSDVPVIPVIADIRDRARIRRAFAAYRPDVVFHAAAHKHVPLMEDSIAEAISNNVTGTRHVVDAAIEFAVERFVLISTDKAVRPTSVMGATKCVAEQIVQHAAMKHGQNFVSVRFGNVLGSRGSVVPTFLRQIRRGGPVTITHPEMQRYFMTIPEAVQLVLQAGALGTGGEVFVLDMGNPVRVVDIANDLIRLSGLEPGTDVKIHFTGIRPGEKLYEEMFFGAEEVLPTEHPKVMRARNGLLADGTMKRIETMIRAVEAEAPDDELRKFLQALVPDFRPHAAPSEDGEIRAPLEPRAPVEIRTPTISA